MDGFDRLWTRAQFDRGDTDTHAKERTLYGPRIGYRMGLSEYSYFFTDIYRE